MDLNVAVSTATELFEDNDIVFPVLLGRENLKILASPGSESSGVSSLDAEEAKVRNTILLGMRFKYLKECQTYE